MRLGMDIYRPFPLCCPGSIFVPRDETLKASEDSDNTCPHKQKGVVVSQNVSFSHPLFAHLPYRASGLWSHRTKSYRVQSIHREVLYTHVIVNNPSSVGGWRLRHVWNSLCIAI